MSMEPSLLTAKFANFCTSLGSLTSHAMPTTSAYAKLLLDKSSALAKPSFRLSSSSLIVVSTDSALLSEKANMNEVWCKETNVGQSKTRRKTPNTKIKNCIPTYEKPQLHDLQKVEIHGQELSLVLLYCKAKKKEIKKL